MQFYKRLEELRIDHDLSQAELGKILGMKQEQYGRYERGENKLPVDLLCKLCLLYHVSADYILELPKGLPWGR